MADTTRNVVVKFDGDAAKLRRATQDGRRSLETWRRGVEATDTSVTKAARSTKGLSAETRALNLEIGESTRRLRDLQLQRARGGSDSLFGDIRKERRHLKQLQQLLGDVASEATKAGGEAGRGFLGSIVATFQGGASTPILGPILVTALVAAGVVAVASAGPTIGAMLAGSIAAGFGVGALALGIAGAAKDARVVAAAKGLGAHVMAEITAAGRPFVDPLIRSFEKFKATFSSLGIGSEIAKFAPMVDRLADAVTGFVRGAWPGFKRALNQAGPALTILADGLVVLGKAIGDAAGDMAESKGTLAGFRTLLITLVGTVRLVGTVVTWLGDRFIDFLNVGHDMISLAANVADAMGMDGVAGKFRESASGLVDLAHTGDAARAEFDRIAGAAPPAGDAVAGVGSKARIAGRDVAFLNDQVADAIESMLDAKDKAINWEEGLDNLRDSIRENGRTLDIHTEKGRANARAFQDLVRQAEATRVKNLEAGMSAETAAAQFNREVDQVLAIGREAGLTRAQLEKLAKDYRINIIETTYQRTIRQETERENRRANRRAQGGTARPWQTYEVTETGPELLTVGKRQYLMMGAQGGLVTPGDKMRAPGAGGPTIIENHIHIGAEVTRVVRTEIADDKREARRTLLAGSGAR